MPDEYDKIPLVNVTPVTTAPPGEEICYECDGKRVCWSCRGQGARSDGTRCGQCVGRGWCIVCNGDGTLPEGTQKSLED